VLVYFKERKARYRRRKQNRKKESEKEERAWIERERDKHGLKTKSAAPLFKQ
jgi:hypothetical protein